MCEHCGIDHPTTEQVAPELMLLEKAFDVWGNEPDNAPVTNSPEAWAVERFCALTVDKHLDGIMQPQVDEGIHIRDAMRSAAISFMNSGFRLAMFVRDEFASAFPEQVTPPTEQEVRDWVDALVRRREEEQQFMEKVASGNIEVAEVLRHLGIELPKGMTPDDLNIDVIDLGDGKQGINVQKSAKEETGNVVDFPGNYM